MTSNLILEFGHLTTKLYLPDYTVKGGWEWFPTGAEAASRETAAGKRQGKGQQEKEKRQHEEAGT